jgi:Protein of unknown function (DUF1769)
LSSTQNRAETPFPSTFIAGDFSNPFIDFNSFSVTLPYVGLKLDALKYWMRGSKRQPLRFVCRTRPKEGGDEVVFFVIVFELVGDGVVDHEDGVGTPESGVDEKIGENGDTPRTTEINGENEIDCSGVD